MGLLIKTEIESAIDKIKRLENRLREPLSSWRQRKIREEIEELKSNFI